MVPDLQFAVVVMINAAGTQPVTETIVLDALRLFIPDPQIALPTTTPPSAWRAYAGTYNDTLGTLGMGGVISVASTDGGSSTLHIDAPNSTDLTGHLTPLHGAMTQVAIDEWLLPDGTAARPSFRTARARTHTLSREGGSQGAEASGQNGARAPTGSFPGERHVGVDRIDLQRAAQIGQPHAPAGLGDGERPRAVVVATKVLDAHLVLGDQHVVPQRGDALVVGEVASAVETRGRLRQHLDEQRRVRDRVGVLRGRGHVAAHDRQVQQQLLPVAETWILPSLEYTPQRPGPPRRSPPRAMPTCMASRAWTGEPPAIA